MSLRKFYFTYSFVYYDAEGRGEMMHEIEPLKADCEEAAIIEAVPIRDMLIKHANEKKEQRKVNPVHGKKRYNDMYPIKPRVICEISLEP